MKKQFAIGLLVATLIMSAVPSLVFADNNGIKSNIFDPLSPSFALQGPLIVCTGNATANSAQQFPTCNNLCDLVAQIANVIYYMIAVIIWIIAPVMAVVGGIMIMLGGTSPEMVGRGKKTITGAVWGIVIALCSWLIVYTAIFALGNLRAYIGFFPDGPNCSPPAAPPPFSFTSPLY